MQEIRIVSHLSPNLEEKLVKYEIDADLVDALLGSENVYESFRHITLLIIPIELYSIFKSDHKLRILLEKIESTSQSNVIFSKSAITFDCGLDDFSKIFKLYPNSLYSKKQIINCLGFRKVPVLVDSKTCIVKKEACSGCENSRTCEPEYEIHTSVIPNVEKFREKLKDVVGKGIDYWHIKRNSISGNDLKVLGFMACLFHNIPDKDIPKSTDYHIHDSLCDDLKDNPESSFVNIAFSMSRAFLYPSAADTNTPKSEFSIDWHINNPSKEQGIQLFRVDVVSPMRTGVGISGTERLLLAVAGDEKTFLAYTPTHDFTYALIKERVQDLKRGQPKDV